MSSWNTKLPQGGATSNFDVGARVLGHASRASERNVPELEHAQPKRRAFKEQLVAKSARVHARCISAGAVQQCTLEVLEQPPPPRTHARCNFRVRMRALQSRLGKDIYTRGYAFYLPRRGRGSTLRRAWRWPPRCGRTRGMALRESHDRKKLMRLTASRRSSKVGECRSSSETL